MATVVYRYGLRRRTDGEPYTGRECVCGRCAPGQTRCRGRASARYALPEQVQAQLRLVWEMRQDLVSIEHGHEAALKAVWSAIPEIRRVEEDLARAEQEVAGLTEQARAEHVQDRTAATRPATAAALRQARSAARELRVRRRELIAAHAGEKRDEVAALKEARQQAVAACRKRYAARGLYWACTDDQTEILTDSGWRHHHELSAGDTVLTLNLDTGLAEWQPVLAVHQYDVANAEMLSMESRDHSSLSTLNHRWPVFWTDCQGKPWQEWRTSADLPATGGALRQAAPLTDPPAEPKWPDPFVELVAWFFAERSAEPGPGRNHPGVNIHQSHRTNPANADRVRRALTMLYGDAANKTPGADGNTRHTVGSPAWRETSADGRSDMTVFRLNKAAADPLLEVAPNRLVSLDFIRSLTAAQLDLFVQTAIRAYRSQYPDGSSMFIAHDDPARLDALEFAAILAGYSTRRYPQRTGMPRRPAQALSIRRSSLEWLQSQRRQTTRYTGVVWCPTTPNGTWLARRKGTVYFTGNSYNMALTDHGVAVRLVERRRAQAQSAQLRHRRYDGTGSIAVQLPRRLEITAG